MEFPSYGHQDETALGPWPCPYLLQRVHLGGHLVDVGVYFHQIHAVQGTLQEIHHRLQLEVGVG